MGGTFVATATILVAAVALGHGVLRLTRADGWSWTAPAVGLAASVIVATLAIRLPGDGVTAGVVLLVLTAAGLAARRSLPRREGLVTEGLVTASLVLAATLIPFVVNGRFGLLGMSFNDDASRHLLAVEFLRTTGEVPESVFGIAYPHGPHALVAAVAAVTGVRTDLTLDALLISIPILTALTALTAARELPRSRAVIAAVAAGLAYLAAAYFAAAAFKETLMALWLLAFAVTLERRQPIPLALLTAACVYTYSYPGLAWPLGTLAIWALLDRPPIKRPAPGVLAAAALLVVLLLPALGSIGALFRSVGLSPAQAGAIAESNLGYTVGQLSPAEALGIWPSGDYRLAPQSAPAEWLATLAGAAAFLYGVWWLARRREFELVAAAGAAALIYAGVRWTESPWISAKALVILSPVAVLLAARALLAHRRTLIAAAFIAGALGSTVLVLRTAQVEPPQHRAELESLARDLQGEKVLLLTNDYYGAWRLFDADVAQPGHNAPVRPEKRYRDGDPTDFDAPPPETLAAHRYAITTRSGYGSFPPPGFRPQRRTASYVLWTRGQRPPPPHQILAEGPAPGAPYACDARRAGTATTRSAPVEAALPPTLRAGAEVTATLRLPPGRYELSLQYRSPRELRLSGPGVSGTAPANLDRVGPLWRVGTASTQGNTPVTVSMPGEALPLLRKRVAALGRLVATPAGERPRSMALPRACGRYVDWLTGG